MKKEVKLSKSGRKICLALINPVYKKTTHYIKTPSGQVLKKEKEKFQKETRVLKWMDLDAIVSIEEYITKKGEVAKNRSIIFDKYSNRFYATWHSVKEIIEVLEDRKEDSVGFRRYLNVSGQAT
jgi:hypothetical protein